MSRLAALLLLLLAGCATFDPLEDTRIEAEVKARLVAEKTANLTRIGVQSRDATVRLSGAVPSRDQSERAEMLARTVKGVREVDNALKVGTPLP